MTVDRDTLLTELAHIGAEVKHCKGQLDRALAASEGTIQEAYEAGMSVDEVVTALGGPLP